MVKFWDLRSPNPAGVLNLPGPFVDMDCSTFPMATFMVGREIIVYDLQNKKEIKVTIPKHITVPTHIAIFAVLKSKVLPSR